MTNLSEPNDPAMLPSHPKLSPQVSQWDRAPTLLLWLIAGASLILATKKILFSIDLSWDSLAYHLPFSGRLAGVCLDDCYRMNPGLEERFLSFPKVVHYMQAAVWSWSGSPQFLGFVNLGALLTLCAFLRTVFRVPLPLAFLAFLAIPLVLIHSTSDYVDLTTNVAATIALLLLYNLFTQPEQFGPGRLAGFFIACAIFANAKIQMIVPAGALAGSMALILLATAWRKRAPFANGRCGVRTAAALCVAGLLLVALNPIVNLFQFGNPIYPIGLSIGPLTLPGNEQVAQPASISHALTDVPGPLRWVMSVLEINAYNFRETPWTIDQGYVTQQSPSFRMGGYGVVVVLLNLVFLIVQVAGGAGGRRMARTAALLFAATTVVTSLLPLSHELRYYMFWMLLLVSLNLVLLHASPADKPANERIRLYTTGTLIAFLSLNLVSGGRHLLFPTGHTIDGFIKASGIADQIRNQVKDGDTVCLRNTMPMSYLYAPIFHQGRHYTVLEDAGPETPCDVALNR